MKNKITASFAADVYRNLAGQKVYEPSHTFYYTHLGKLEKYLQYYDVGEAVPIEEGAVFSSEASKQVHHSLMVLNGALAQNPDLTNEEKVGFELLRQAMEFRYEHFDGTGLPGRFEGEQIPPIARILAIALAITDGMLQQQPLSVLFAKLERNVGKEFDPAIMSLAKATAEVWYQRQEATLARYRYADTLPVEMQYIPVVDSLKEKTVMFLGRLVLNDPKQGAIQPEVYSSVAEKNGRLAPLTLVGLEQVCQRLSGAKFDPSVAALPVSVEVSPTTLRKKSFLAAVEKIFCDYSVDPSMVRFAITETALAYEDQPTLTAFDRLKGWGSSLVLRRFGTEYASLAKLSEWDFDAIELDGGLIGNLAENHKTYEIVKSILQMADSLSLRVIATDVDHPKQRELLTELGCRYMQGDCLRNS